jgi:hypothetical protein
MAMSSATERAPRGRRGVESATPGRRMQHCRPDDACDAVPPGIVRGRGEQ